MGDSGFSITISPQNKYLYQINSALGFLPRIPSCTYMSGMVYSSKSDLNLGISL